MNEKCFALKRGSNECRVLLGNCPGHSRCKFYKPRWLLDKKRRAAFQRLRSLPLYKQEEIANKYYDGNMSWRGEYE